MFAMPLIAELLCKVDYIDMFKFYLNTESQA
jgi:hypothetical protein